MGPSAAEITYIGIDNSFWVCFRPVFMAQIKAIKEYCSIKLKCNPENRVGLFKMASYNFNDPYGELLSPTSDFQQILRSLEDLEYDCEGQVDFRTTVEDIGAALRFCPPNMKRRLLVFVGSPINLHVTDVKRVGNILKEMEIALDVVNFFVLKRDMSREERSKLYEKYTYAREELRELVAFVDDKDNTNSRMVDVDVSSVCDILSQSILKKNIRYLRKKDQRKAKKNVNVKQEPEPSRSEKNKTAVE